MMLRAVMLFFVTVSCILFICDARAQEDVSGQTALATAKIAGACGVLNSMINFQKTTRMQGGDEFVSRFWAVEAARLGMSVEQMSKQCDSAVGLYDLLWKTTEQKTR